MRKHSPSHDAFSSEISASTQITPSFRQMQSLGALSVPDMGVCLAMLREMQTMYGMSAKDHARAQAIQGADARNHAASVVQYAQARPLDHIAGATKTSQAHPHDAASVIALNREKAKGWRKSLLDFTWWTSVTIFLGVVEIGLNGSSLSTALPDIAGQQRAVGNDAVVLITLATAVVCAFIKPSESKSSKLLYWACTGMGLSVALLSGFAVVQSFFMGGTSETAVISAGGIGGDALANMQAAGTDSAQRSIVIAEGVLAGLFGPFAWFGIKYSVENASKALKNFLEKRGFADIATQIDKEQRADAITQAELNSRNTELEAQRNNLTADVAGAISKLCATKRAPVEAWLNELDLAGSEADRSALPPEVRGYDLTKLRALVKTHQSQTSFEAIQANLLKAISPNKDMSDVQAEFDFDRPHHNGADRDGLPQASH